MAAPFAWTVASGSRRAKVRLHSVLRGPAIMSSDQPVPVYLLCNARFHDTDFARVELLKLLGEQPDVVTRVGEDYSQQDAICASKLLITYTCDVRPSLAEQQALKRFLEGGGRWFALHATNAIIEFVGAAAPSGGLRIPGKASTPDLAPLLMELLGSRFISHPANQNLHVRVKAPLHPVVSGIQSFDIVDEPYYCEFHGAHTTLLEADYDAPATGYVVQTIDRPGPHPIMYTHPVGRGEVLYLTLGHCRGKYDMRPFMPVCPVDRVAWGVPEFYELLRRGIRWGIGAL